MIYISNKFIKYLFLYLDFRKKWLELKKAQAFSATNKLFYILSYQIPLIITFYGIPIPSVSSAELLICNNQTSFQFLGHGYAILIYMPIYS